jgi:hypothetical protein
MRDQDTTRGDQSGAAGTSRAVTRRSVLTMAAMVTAGLAISSSVLPALAQGRMEIDGDRSRGREFERDGDRFRDDDRFRDRDAERRYEGRRDGKWEMKAEPKGDAKWDGKAEDKEVKDGRKPGKSGHIKLTVGGDGATAVDVKCADGEPMRACADITKEIIDKIRPPK